MKGKKKSPAVVRTTEEFASHTTVHGISYIFDRSLPIADRLLWLVVVVSFLALASYLSYNSYTEWRGEQVITTLKDTVMPVTEVAFPAITICGGGNHMDNVERAVLEDFTKWRQDNERKGVETVHKDLAEYMFITFQIADPQTNILDILDTMIASNVDQSVTANGIRENIIACSMTEATESPETSKTTNAVKTTTTTTSAILTTTTVTERMKGPAMLISEGDIFQLLTPTLSLLLNLKGPEDRQYHVAEFVPDGLVICGGQVVSGDHLPCYQLSPSCSGWTRPSIQARTYAASVRIGDKMQVLGGYDDSATRIDSIENFQKHTGVWTTGIGKTKEKAGACAVLLGYGNVTVLGGTNQYGFGQRKGFLLNITEGTSTQLPDAPTNIDQSGCTAGSYQGNRGVFVSGGTGTEKKSLFFDLTEMEWKTLPDHSIKVHQGLSNPGGRWGGNPIAASSEDYQVEQFDGTKWNVLNTTLEKMVTKRSAVTTVPEWFAHWLIGVEQVDWATSKCEEGNPIDIQTLL